MSNLPSVKPDRLLKALERAGFFIHHVSGSHYVLRHPERPRVRIVVPHHSGDIKRGVLRSIMQQAELTVEELNRLL